MYICLHIKHRLFLGYFNENCIFANDFRKKSTQTQNSTKIRPAGAELFHADGRTDTTKLIVAFRNFANEPKKTDNANEPSFYVKHNIRLKTRSDGAQLLLITSQADGHDLSYVPVVSLRGRIA